MTQRLTLPLNNCNVNAGYKVAAYKKQWGFHHYGIDLGHPNSQREIYSPGDGEIIDCGLDGNTTKERMGYAVVIVFRDVIMNNGKKTDLACRMFHLDRITVTRGQKIKRGDVIGYYGNTGQYTSGPHLHVEFDTDIDWPAYAYGIASSGKVIKKGSVDSTVDPSKVWFLGDGQQIRSGWGSYNDWVSTKDTNIPKLPTEVQTPAPVAPTPTLPTTPALEFKVGDIVQFTGSKQYISANNTASIPCKSGEAKVTAIYPSGKHPYHLRTTGGFGGVYGWVDASDVYATVQIETYTVQRGDSLWLIAKKMLGDGNRYKEIREFNGMKNDTIHPGDVLKIPRK